MSDKNVKRFFILFIVIGFVLLGTFSVGASYALLENSTKDEDSQIIQTGNVSVKLSEYFDSIDKQITVMSDEEGALSDVSYDFKVKNTGTASSLYSLSLKNSIPSGFEGKVLDYKYVKVCLEINGERQKPFNLQEVNNILISNQKIEAKELISFKMKIWFDEKYKNELANNLDAKLFLKLNVKASQDIGDNTDLTTLD